MTFCNVSTSSSILANKTTSEPNIDYVFYQSMKDVSTDWDIAAPASNLFLQRKYLNLLEENAPNRMQFRYILFYKNDMPIGVANCQIQAFNADDSLQQGSATKQKSRFLSTVSKQIKHFVASRFEFNTLICGNLLLTGEHGFYFQEGLFSKAIQFELVRSALHQLCKDLKKDKLEISVNLLKEYCEECRSSSQPLLDENYKEFTIQPNMILDIRPDWKTFDDYLGAMYSKYRVRVKRAMKKGKDIVRKSLSADEIRENLDLLYSLYEEVASGAGFNVMKLNKNYFLALKETLQDNFTLMAYYLDNQIIGYYTLINNHKELEAHFLGFDKSKNHSHQIYLNMLYDMVRVGIEQQFKQIIFARTALEIKSSVGAEAHEMYCYMRHRSQISNHFLTTIYEYLKPDDEWQPRHPFKPVEEAE